MLLKVELSGFGTGSPPSPEVVVFDLDQGEPSYAIQAPHVMVMAKTQNVCLSEADARLHVFRV